MRVVLVAMIALAGLCSANATPPYEQQFAYEKVSRLNALDSQRACLAKAETIAELDACK